MCLKGSENHYHSIDVLLLIQDGDLLSCSFSSNKIGAAGAIGLGESLKTNAGLQILQYATIYAEFTPNGFS
jgi:hypothetical protein